MKAIYRHNESGDVFAIETDEAGDVVATCGPLFGKDFDPKNLDYDGYWNREIQGKLTDFERVSFKTPSPFGYSPLAGGEFYLELLRQNGFITDFNQRYLF